MKTLSLLQHCQGHGFIRNISDTHCSSSSGRRTPSGHRPHGAESKGHQQSLNLDQSDQGIKIPEIQAEAENFISRKHHFLSGAIRLRIQLQEKEDHSPKVQRTYVKALAEHRIPRGEMWALCASR